MTVRSLLVMVLTMALTTAEMMAPTATDMETTPRATARRGTATVLMLMRAMRRALMVRVLLLICYSACAAPAAVTV
jgi:hypothetical protein